jgi:ribonuclease P protein component
MIPHRLKVPKDIITQVLKRGSFVAGEYVTVKFLSLPEQINSKFTVVVTKKVSKLAVKRHLNQRKIYEVIGGILKESQPGFNVLIFPKQDLGDLESQPLKEEILKIFKKIGIVS